MTRLWPLAPMGLRVLPWQVIGYHEKRWIIMVGDLFLWKQWVLWQEVAVGTPKKYLMTQGFTNLRLESGPWGLARRRAPMGGDGFHWMRWVLWPIWPHRVG